MCLFKFQWKITQRQQRMLQKQIGTFRAEIIPLFETEYLHEKTIFLPQTSYDNAYSNYNGTSYHSGDIMLERQNALLNEKGSLLNMHREHPMKLKGDI